ncbi:uncharacterized protein LOC122881414 isoform X2 [Siniperca chuatsi]|uniref:uncharacterized protein LOC122881414 isoform X2 n=1 Tax=Siniperca chuatsi TaxID=119488 RepID=UPI001CE0FE3F|nr:uncharacterized protein LOC122881414 isoform X2 [Siniperca chuatsi]
MKLFMYCVGLLLSFATMVVTTPIRVYRNPPSKPVKEQDSEDMSEENSAESLDANGFTDAFKDLDSHEIMIPKVVEKDKAPSRRNTGDNMGPMDMSSMLVRDQGSGEHSGPHGAHQASRERTDLNSEEEVMVVAQEAENVSGKQVIRSSGAHMTDSDSLGTNVQRKATPGRVNGFNGMLAPGRSRELLDWDSLEDNNGRPAPVVNRGDTDDDETRECISSETSPIAPPEHKPSSLSVPAKSRAS